MATLNNYTICALSWIRTNAVWILSPLPLPLGYKGLAEDIGFEPMVKFNSHDQLATDCFRPLSQSSLRTRFIECHTVRLVLVRSQHNAVV